MNARARVATTIWLAGCALAALLALAPGLSAQDAGDKVVLTLKSGRTYSGDLISRSTREVTIRIGDSEIALPMAMVQTIEAAPGEASDAPAPVVPKAPSSPAAPPTDEPTPAAIILKDGTVLEGFVVKKGNGRLSIVPGRAREVSEEQVDGIIGNTSLAGDGLNITGDAEKDSFRLIKELESGDHFRIRTATALLTTYGDKAGAALLRGLKSEDVLCRKTCLNLLSASQNPAGMDPILDLLRNDPLPDIRAMAAGALSMWQEPLVRRTLLEAAWRDREESVKSSAIRTLTTMVTVEEVSGLIDLLNILPQDSPTRGVLFGALRRSTSQKFSDDRNLWLTWWEQEGGRDDIGDKVQAVILRRMNEESRPR